ncbi:hypothetical protein B0O80DRAFT_492743 [Mortierella sp. GBAus27b]|nr:hypothetical protein BGX31_007532 [Mortierella sp. GBA43]KAI8363616.1 hypothetical protein B0O80DRAFT_492743 [Mortierella sp. GBAus27b]
MLSTKSTTLISAFFIAALASVSQAHSSLYYPCARGSTLNKEKCPNNGGSDYDIRTPIGTHDSKNFPLCKNAGPSQITVLKAGENITTRYDIGANHGGGHCQWAISYDQKNWVVIQTQVRSCLQGSTAGSQHPIGVVIPKNAPNGKATLMWLWNNAIGNRELYSNCADIEIQGGAEGGSLNGAPPVIANYGPDSIAIGEFPNASDPDGKEHFLFENSKNNITISPSGGSGAPSKPATGAGDAPKPSSSAAQPKPTGGAAPYYRPRR